MYISRIKLHNFKGFKGDHELCFDEGVNFFVGDNNSGKSSVFEAIDFIRSKRTRDEVITKKITEEDYVSVEVVFEGDDVEKIIQLEPLKKYQSYVNNNTLRIMRSSNEESIIQAGKKKNLSINNVRVFNPKSNQFENPTGIDNTITALFDAQFVWADADSSDVADFSKTKICGKIINALTKDFIKSDTWKNFSIAHEKTFGSGEHSLAKTLKPIEKRLQSIMSEQYGDTQVRFNFSLPEIENFFKTGNIELSENGIETKSSEKGTGMQRALALSLIQVYSEINTPDESQVTKPLMFFLDEPETFLHPQAQNRLLNALERISTTSQVFIITHSPYLLKKYKKETHSMNVFSKEKGFNKVDGGNDFNLFGSSSPTWGEINYYAFGVVSEEFHNELYGFVQAKAIQIDEKYYYPKDFDDYLVVENSLIKKNEEYEHLRSDGTTFKYYTTLPTKIRNIIHHPENTHNKRFTDKELRDSIEMLITLMK